MKTQRQVQTQHGHTQHAHTLAAAVPEARRPDKLRHLLVEIAEDAQGRSESYPVDSRVPEGGE